MFENVLNEHDVSKTKNNISLLARAVFVYEMNCDDHGSFTELLKTLDSGQLSVNISKPRITKDQHWNNSKWEFFVLSGHGLIQERKIGTDEVIEFEDNGDHIQAVI